MQGWRVPQAALRRVGTRAVLGPQRLEVQLLGGCSPPEGRWDPLWWPLSSHHLLPSYLRASRPSGRPLASPV